MVTVKKDELKAWLRSKKQDVELPKFSGVGEMISAISLWFTLCTSHFEDIPVVRSHYFQSAMYLVAAAVFVIGAYNMYSGFRSRKVIENIYEGILELEAGRVHTVNIVLFKNAPEQGKYLLVKNRAWRCELFHSYNAMPGPYDQEKERERVRECFARDIGIAPKYLKLSYRGFMPEHSKLCAGANVPYRYLFYFYHVELTTADIRLGKSFRYNGNAYVWRSLNQMFSDQNIMKKNGDVVDFVASLEGIPYN